MLKSLTLKNIALIDKAEIEFNEGLNVLSGETGSGKSVVVDSINFVLGAKADKTMIRFGETECSATAVFDLSNCQSAKDLLSEYGIEFDDDEVIVTRKLAAEGKNSIRINGEQITLGMLKAFSSSFVDFHGQSDHYLLTKESAQLSLTDKFTANELEDIKKNAAEVCATLRKTDENMKSFGGSESERAIRADILKFQIDEIQSAEIEIGEEDELLAKRKKAQNAEKIADAFSGTKNAIDGENCAIDLLNSAMRKLGQISSVDDSYSNIAQRIKNVCDELSDISYFAEDALDSLDVDEAEADRIEDRLDKIKTIKRKYGPTEQDVFDFLEKAKVEYDKIQNFDAEYAKLTAEKSALLKKLNSIYSKMSEKRRASAKILSQKVENELKDLGMKDASFEISFAPLAEVVNAPYSENGGDKIEFLFSANLGEPRKNMAKIISGGEMSRLMLSLKTVLSSYNEISTYIFDEIDAGISGRAAETVAEKFAKISKHTQVIAISHLPQIVAFADASFRIGKFVENEKTLTKIERMNDDGKTEEILRLIGGDKSSSSAVEHAEETIRKADEFKKHIS